MLLDSWDSCLDALKRLLCFLLLLSNFVVSFRICLNLWFQKFKCFLGLLLFLVLQVLIIIVNWKVCGTCVLSARIGSLFLDLGSSLLGILWSLFRTSFTLILGPNDPGAWWWWWSSWRLAPGSSLQLFVLFFSFFFVLVEFVSFLVVS